MRPNVCSREKRTYDFETGLRGLDEAVEKWPIQKVKLVMENIAPL
jgi:hypothetical protein